jgi:hypothetical protein
LLFFWEEPGLSLTIKITVHNPICKYNLQRNENYIQILAIPDLPSRRRSEPSKNLTTTPTKEWSFKGTMNSTSETQHALKTMNEQARRSGYQPSMKLIATPPEPGPVAIYHPGYKVAIQRILRELLFKIRPNI